MQKTLVTLAAVAATLASLGAETPPSPAASGFWEEWQPRTILVGNERDGWNDKVEGRARFNSVEFTDSICCMPFAVRDPETKDIVLVATMGNDRLSKLMESADGGETWTAPHNFGGYTIGGVWGLCIPGNGVMVLNTGYDRTDDGWKTMTGSAVTPDPRFNANVIGWDGPYVFPDSHGKHLLDFASVMKNFRMAEGTSLCVCRESFDAGATWTDWRGVPEFANGVETVVTHNAKGELIAAIRVQNFMQVIDDQSCRLEYSISKDGGKTWCPPKVVAGQGRHHPSLCLLPDGRMVLSYVVRIGYPDEDGKHVYGIEAVVSTDDGHTWDTDHRYMLARWSHDGVITDEATGKPYYMDRSGAAPQGTSTFYDAATDSMLTIYGTYQDIAFLRDGSAMPTRICAVKWKLLDHYSPPAPRPQARTADEALAALRSNAFWSANYHPVTGLPDGGWLNLYPDSALAIHDGKWLRMDHSHIDVGQLEFRGVDQLSRINGPYGFRIQMNYLPGTAVPERPERVLLYAILGTDMDKEALLLQFFDKGRMTSDQFGEVTLPVTDGTPFLVEGYIDPLACNAKLWVDGKLITDRTYERKRLDPKTAFRLIFGYGSKSISGIMDLGLFQLGQITRR